MLSIEKDTLKLLDNQSVYLKRKVYDRKHMSHNTRKFTVPRLVLKPSD